MEKLKYSLLFMISILAISIDGCRQMTSMTKGTVYTIVLIVGNIIIESLFL